MQEEKVVFSRSQTLFAGTKALGDAMELFVPSSKAFMNSETELWNFLCSLRHEGFAPLILTSKDVYGYSSCRAVVPEKCELVPSGRHGTQRAVIRALIRQQLLLHQKKQMPEKGATDAVDNQKGKNVTSPQVPPASNGGSAKSLKESAKALMRNTKVTVGKVSTARDLARARRQAEQIMRVSLQPSVRLYRMNVLPKRGRHVLQGSGSVIRRK